MPSGLYPGKGVKLPLASSNPQEPVWASMRVATYVIPSGSSSMGIAGNAGLTTAFNITFASAPAGTAFNVMYCITPDFSGEYVLQAVPAVALTTQYTWATNGLIELDGFLRITNAGGQNISSVFAQQRATTVG